MAIKSNRLCFLCLGTCKISPEAMAGFQIKIVSNHGYCWCLIQVFVQVLCWCSRYIWMLEIMSINNERNKVISWPCVQSAEGLRRNRVSLAGNVWDFEGRKQIIKLCWCVGTSSVIVVIRCYNVLIHKLPAVCLRQGYLCLLAVMDWKTGKTCGKWWVM